MISLKATPQAAPAPTFRFQTLSSPNVLPIYRFGPTRPRSITLRICCSKETEKPSDESLAADLLLQINKFNTETAQRQDAFNKSRALLFAEMSDFVGLNSEDFTNKWRRMKDDEKWILVKGFVAEWSAHYHPLSARSVRELVEEYVGGGTVQSVDSASATLFSDFTKLLGFHRDG